MSTIVFLHAHPDDETSQTAGMMALASREGHRVVTVFATDGDHGERPDHLGPDGDLVEHRRGEARAAAAVLGAARIDWLGYRDSGMTGWEQNDDPRCLHGADVDEAAARVARILDRENADVLVGYDYHGNYGHPDHIAVHRIARRAVELAAHRPRLLEATTNRDAQLEMIDSPEAVAFLETLAAGGMTMDVEQLRTMILTGDDGLPVGVAESEIAWAIDLPGDVIDLKRSAMQCHASQTSDIGMMLALPPEVYALSFGTEYLIDPGTDEPMRRGWPFG
ncbi:PIG-L family deacetylase [Dietzia sp. ANT_WB102]|uniref:PIG-L family deacetylase n=1 Tax=Dietzia sp. ANT_WB102 TaxID=2597345 RepID=UPI0011EC314A|nr:PIG-L family deacetylase [Dietzia sp. ANT_WB102]KAA0918619.1 GlcNAc-PI de-N-acetylase [Dietzia sp. ANT_WB102]